MVRPKISQCSVEGCELGGKITRGLCRKHYYRWQQHGDPLVTLRHFDDPEACYRQKVVEGDGCFDWTGSLSTSGYAQLRIKGKLVHAHRWVYERWVGPIPEGYDIDHTCHNADLSCRGGHECPHRRCTRTDHLEAVPHVINARRGRTGQYLSERTHCDNGHAWTQANTLVSRGYRRCRECHRLESLERSRRANGVTRPRV